MKQKVTPVIFFAFLTVNVFAQNLVKLEKTAEAELRLGKTQEKALEVMLSLKVVEEVKPKPTLAMTAAEMSSYVGTYTQPNRFKIEISTKDGKLFVKEFNQEMPLNKIGENRFSFQFLQAKQPVEIYVNPAVGGKSGFVHQYVRAFKKI